MVEVFTVPAIRMARPRHLPRPRRCITQRLPHLVELVEVLNCFLGGVRGHLNQDLSGLAAAGNPPVTEDGHLRKGDGVELPLPGVFVPLGPVAIQGATGGLPVANEHLPGVGFEDFVLPIMPAPKIDDPPEVWVFEVFFNPVDLPLHEVLRQPSLGGQEDKFPDVLAFVVRHRRLAFFDVVDLEVHLVPVDHFQNLVEREQLRIWHLLPSVP